MHEFSVMSQIVDSILSEANKRKATKIEQVDLQVGEYTMLGEEQLKFAYEVLSKDTILKGSKLKISHIKGKIECACGYRGRIEPSPDSPHRIVPILECPKCKGAAKIVEGRECVIRNIRMVVPDV
ncbi:MAG: hydrogenase maturation nickel metallochaperone HypA [Thermoplasmata archaeon]